MESKPKVFLTSNVFSEDQIGSNEKISIEIRNKIKNLWQKLNEISNLKVFDGRFPTEAQIGEIVENFNPHIIGCHLSHPIKSELLKNSNIFSIHTSTAGFNHIFRTDEDAIIMTHTPGVLHETVADYTIAIIMANLRNLIDLHNYVWSGNWTPDDKWDLDQELSSVIDNKIVGIVGLGEIGREVMKRLSGWGLTMQYYDIRRSLELEELYPSLIYKENLKDLFRECDIISIHVPLMEATRHLINAPLLKLMKKNALLVNTARGPVVSFEDLLTLLENGEIKINLSFDVYPEEPLDPDILQRFKKVKESNPEIRMILMPHNASADADTRGKMDIMFLKDIIKTIQSKNLKDLEELHLIPKHKRELYDKEWKILEYWN